MSKRLSKRLIGIVSFLALLVCTISVGFTLTLASEPEQTVYNAKESFGDTSIWSYQRRKGDGSAIEDMGLNGGGDMYLASANYISKDWMSVGVDPNYQTMLTFTAPRAGTIHISSEGQLINLGAAGDYETGVTTAQIWDKNNTTLGYVEIPTSDTPVDMDKKPIAENGFKVEKGDTIHFVLWSNSAKNQYVSWVPVITYGEETKPDGEAYNAKESFGNTSIWSYQRRKGDGSAIEDMGLNGGGDMYLASANYISKDWMSVGVDPNYQTMLTFTAPRAGTIHISSEGQLINLGAAGDYETGVTTAQIWDKNNTTLGYVEIPTSDTPVDMDKKPIAENGFKVEKGDTIHFVLWSNSAKNQYVSWVPVITYETETSDSTTTTSETTTTAESTTTTDSTATSTEGSTSDTTESTTGSTSTPEPEEETYNAREEFNTADSVWSYHRRQVVDNAYEPLSEFTNDDYGGWFSNGENRISPNWMSVGLDTNYETVLIFTAPHAGTISISSEDGITNHGNRYTESDITPANARVWDKNNDKKELAYYNIPASNDTVATPVIENVQVEAGDEIRFFVSRNGQTAADDNLYIGWVPVITYTEETTPSSTDGSTSSTSENTTTSTTESTAAPEPDEKIYNAKTGFGDEDLWSYQRRQVVDNAYEDMTLTDSENGNIYVGGDSYISPDWLTVGTDPEYETVLNFIAPYTGTISISSVDGIANHGHQYNESDISPANARVWDKNNKELAYYTIPASTDTVATPVIENIEVEKGDVIRFFVSRNGQTAADDNLYISWVPVITYTEVETTTSSTNGTTAPSLPRYDANAEFSGEQGGTSGVWNYLSREVVSNVYTELEWTGSQWEDGMGGIITDSWMHATADASDTHESQIVLEFTAPYSGTVSISDKAGQLTAGNDTANGVKLWVWKNNDSLIDGEIILQAGETAELSVPTVQVTKGDKIRFIVTAINGDNAGDMLFISPVISYLSVQDGPVATTAPGAQEDVDNVQTGHPLNMAAVSMLLISAALAGVLMVKKVRTSAE